MQRERKKKENSKMESSWLPCVWQNARPNPPVEDISVIREKES